MVELLGKSMNSQKSICKYCSRKNLCEKVYQQQKQIESKLKMDEGSVVPYYSILLELEEKRYSYPDSYYYCEFPYLPQESLEEIIAEQEELLQSIKPYVS